MKVQGEGEASVPARSGGSRSFMSQLAWSGVGLGVGLGVWLGLACRLGVVVRVRARVSMGQLAAERSGLWLWLGLGFEACASSPPTSELGVITRGDN